MDAMRIRELLEDRATRAIRRFQVNLDGSLNFIVIIMWRKKREAMDCRVCVSGYGYGKRKRKRKRKDEGVDPREEV